MPIRINLLAEQQATEEARRKDPVKRGIILGSSVAVVFLVWALMVHLQLKAKTLEYNNLQESFARVEEKAKGVRLTIAQTGQLETKVASLERYSTNRVLWASMLDAMQQSSIEQIRFKEIGTRQSYFVIPTNTFFTTNIAVPWIPPTPGWKFWAGPSKAPSPLTLASNEFKTFTNAPPFSTNKLAYKISTSIVGTNMQNNTVAVKCNFTLPFVSIEDIDVTVRGRDYGTPPGTSIDAFLQKLLGLPYFIQWVGTSGENRFFFPERQATPEKDPIEPGTGAFLKFTLQLNYQKRVLTNE